MATFFQLTRTNWHHSDERDLYYHKTFNFATLKEALPNLLCWADKKESSANTASSIRTLSDSLASSTSTTTSVTDKQSLKSAKRSGLPEKTEDSRKT